ncbi:hypothetical protein [Aeromicrobium sp. REDSEA-S38_B2]|jgi:hypothetical protein|uniref:hypothetical protein n=1 Tax=Aeromicrobium sp. REDSEA-S38_B2 TaxID=1811528 RepID=UPI000B2F0294|nr:hypothetical protein [Aeromicrobium sp. REDSEA-S38_B2]
MPSTSPRRRVVLGFVAQAVALAVLALVFVAGRRALDVDPVMNWSLFGQLVLFTTFASVLGAIYRRPHRDHHD